MTVAVSAPTAAEYAVCIVLQSSVIRLSVTRTTRMVLLVAAKCTRSVLERYGMDYWAVCQMREGQAAKTPKMFLALLKAMHFDKGPVFDPCPPEPKADGLLRAWTRQNFVNPPFSDLRHWISKAGSEPGHTVLLMPARVCTRYFIEMLSVGKAVTLWCNYIKFQSYSGAFPIPICTVEFGRHRSRRVKDVVVYSVAAHVWDLGARCDIRSLHSLAQRNLAPKCEMVLPSTLLGRRNRTYFVTVRGEADASAVWRFLDADRRRCVIALTYTCLHCVYMKPLLPWVRHIAFTASRFMQGDKHNSMVHVVAMSQNPVGYSARDAPSCSLYLAHYTPEYTLSD